MTLKNDLTYLEAIEQIMLHNGYFAPLKIIYKELWKYKDQSKILGKTPFNTVQAIVQRDKKFTKIGLGVYALTEHLNKLPKLTPPKTESEKRERLHAKYQGMLIEIGNNRNEVINTYTNDKKWLFENKTLGSLATISEVPLFTYEKIINETIRYFDVIWFNERGFPLKIFEVEESTNFRDAFVKFIELQDFNAKFFCVSDENRIIKFEKEINKVAFQPIKKRCEFVSYNQIESDYSLLLKKPYL